MNETELAPTQAAAFDAAPAAAPVIHDAAEKITTATGDLGGLAADACNVYGYGCEDDPMALLEETTRVRPAPSRTMMLAEDEEAMARREELRQRFQFGTGAKGPNAVTEEEFEKIARLYEHIWDGDRNLKIETAGMGGEADKYKAHVMEQVARMLQTKSGQKLLTYLTYGYERDGKAVNHETVIKSGGDKDGDGSFLDDYWAKADPGRHEDAALDVVEEDGKRIVKGPGKGTSSTVKFMMPDWYQQGIKRADVVLAHELTHSLTQILGYEDNTIVDFPDGVTKDVSGTSPLMRAEHQATGLGLYRNGPFAGLDINERRYIEERNAIGRAGAGEVLPQATQWAEHTILGDDALRPRASYRNDPHVCGAGCGH